MKIRKFERSAQIGRSKEITNSHGSERPNGTFSVTNLGKLISHFMKVFLNKTINL